MDKKHLQRHFRKTLQHYNKKLRKFITDPSEKNIHDIRVATRRVEAAYRIIPKKVRNDENKNYLNNIKNLFKLNSRIRDYDIIGQRLEYKYKERTIDKILELKEKRTKEILEAVKKGKELSRIDIPQIHFSEMKNSKLRTRFLKILDTLELETHKNTIIAVSDETRVEELHRLRKDFKKLRYTLEIIPHKVTKSSLKKLKNIQDVLGVIHDSDIIIHYLQDLKNSQNMSDIIKEEIMDRRNKYELFVKAFERSEKNLEKNAL